MYVHRRRQFTNCQLYTEWMLPVNCFQHFYSASVMEVIALRTWMAS